MAIILLIISHLIIMRDLNRRERDKAELEDTATQNRTLSDMRKKIIITLSHDIRGPLNAISGSAELAMDTRDQKRRNAYLGNILESSRHITRLANSLLDLSRLDDAKETLNEIPFHLESFLESIAEEYTRKANDKGLMFDKAFMGCGITVLGDADRIRQVVVNILENAVKFTRTGYIKFLASYEEDTLSVKVKDTGIGMGENTTQRIFQPFERAAPDLDSEGFGLGLSIVQRIVTMLGGTIRLESEKGKGSRFTVEIPMQTAEELPEQINQTRIHHDRTFHDVIAIDNDEVLLLMLKEMYAQEGVHCETCTDAAELMELIRKKEYSLLLTDLNMPEINGFELLELLRTSNVGNSKTIPVVVTTASGSCSKEELMERGFAGCLLKPFSISELMEVSDKCAMKGNRNEKPDFTSLLSYGNEAVMLEKLITETEKEMQAIRESGLKKYLQELDALTHHLRSSWEILRADQPLKELYKLLHCDGTPDDKTIGNAVKSVLDKGSEIIRLAKEERKKYNNG